MSTLGFVQSDSQSLHSQEQTYGIEVELDADELMANQVVPNDARPRSNDRQKDEGFTFKFPNIFDVFRSLF